MLTKSELLAWINDAVEASYAKVEDLGDCAAYLQLLSAYFPERVNLAKVKCELRSQDLQSGRLRAQRVLHSQCH